MRPVLVSSRPEDPAQRVGFGDQVVLEVPGSQGVARVADGRVYMSVSLRNVGTGLALLHGWHPRTDGIRLGDPILHAPVEEFRRLSRDLYIAPNDFGFWPGVTHSISW